MSEGGNIVGDHYNLFRGWDFYMLAQWKDVGVFFMAEKRFSLFILIYGHLNNL